MVDAAVLYMTLYLSCYLFVIIFFQMVFIHPEFSGGHQQSTLTQVLHTCVCFQAQQRSKVRCNCFPSLVIY